MVLDDNGTCTMQVSMDVDVAFLQVFLVQNLGLLCVFTTEGS
jgi:hypothetical protein